MKDRTEMSTFDRAQLVAQSAAIMNGATASEALVEGWMKRLELETEATDGHREFIGARQVLSDMRNYLASKLPEMPA